MCYILAESLSVELELLEIVVEYRGRSRRGAPSSWSVVSCIIVFNLLLFRRLIVYGQYFQHIR